MFFDENYAYCKIYQSVSKFGGSIPQIVLSKWQIGNQAWLIDVQFCEGGLNFFNE